MKKTLIYSALLILLFSVFIFPQGRGKLTGRIIDGETKEPLIGANVLIDGTSMGAATDFEGRYIILNILPGSYSVTASLIGYGRIKQTGVDIFIDRTTQLDFELVDETIQLEQVIVVAEKPKIIRDQTSTQTTLSADQITAAPIEGLRGALDLSAGLQKTATGNYSVRGSGSYELNFQVDGVSQMATATQAPGAFGNEKADNSWRYDVNPLGVQQLQLITGGFSAEYGNAQAGVVKVVLKEGTPKFTGQFRVEYRPSGMYHFGRYLYDQSHYEWQKWGTLDKWMAQRDVILRELKLDLRYQHLIQAGDSASIALYNQIVDNEIAWAHQVWAQNHTPSDDNPLGIYDYRKLSYQRYMFGFGGPLGRNPNLLRFYFSGEYRNRPTRLPTPEKNQVYQNYILNITYQPVPEHKFKLSGSFQHYVGGIWSGSDDIRWSGIAFSPPGVSSKYYILIDPVRTEQTVTQSLNWVHTINPRSFIEATLYHQYEKYELPYEYLAGWVSERDRLDSLNDNRGSILKDGIWWDNQYFRQLFNFSTNYYQDYRADHWNLNIDYTNQINSTHLLKTGLKISYWDMFNNAVNSSFLANTYVARSGFADYYTAFPYTISLYAQDRMEFEGMIANIGLRAEAYNYQTNVPVDRFDVFYPGISGPGTVGNPLTEPSKIKFVLMPRLGVSFPIGETTAFRIQYGHFSSMPIFSQALSRRTQSGWIGYGNPNLDPQKTINYEFGLQQMLDETHRLDVVVYYNDRVTQVGLQRIAALTGSRDRQPTFTADRRPLHDYTSYANNAFGSSLGLEVILETVQLGDWTYRLSYSISQTTAGNFGPATIYPDDLRGVERRNYTGEFLSGNDRTHNFRGLLQYNVRGDGGLNLFGFKPFANSNFSLTYTAQSGTPFTYITDFTVRDVVNNRRYPLESSFDFNFTKDIEISDYRIILGVRVMNIFNNKWLTPMATTEDIRYWVEEGITVEDPGNAPLRLSHVVADYRAYRNIPRQVFFTIGFGF